MMEPLLVVSSRRGPAPLWSTTSFCPAMRCSPKSTSTLPLEVTAHSRPWVLWGMRKLMDPLLVLMRCSPAPASSSWPSTRPLLVVRVLGPLKTSLANWMGPLEVRRSSCPAASPKAIPPLPVLSWSRPRKGVRMRMPPLEVLAASSLGYSPGA